MYSILQHSYTALINVLGYDISKTTEIYAHVTDKSIAKIQSQLDKMLGRWAWRCWSSTRSVFYDIDIDNICGF